MKILVKSILFLVLFVGIATAQDVAPKFSSVYTGLNKNCKTIKGGEGQDDAYSCSGIGGYRIHIWFSATTQQIAAKAPKSEDMISLATESLSFNANKAKVEWRTANGKPFAIIMRVNKYAEPDDAHPYFGKKIGEELVVKGLQGFEKIDFKVDAKKPNANVEARKLADNAYSNK